MLAYRLETTIDQDGLLNLDQLAFEKRRARRGDCFAPGTGYALTSPAMLSTLQSDSFTGGRADSGTDGYSRSVLICVYFWIPPPG